MAGERLPAMFSLRSQLWFRGTAKCFEIATSHMQYIVCKLKMTKKHSNILFGLLSFLTGVLIAWFTFGQVRQVIRSFYQWTTGNAFQFHGKHIIINLDPIYYVTFGLAVLTIWYCVKELTLKWAILWTGISTFSVIGTAVAYAWIDGNLRVISCTMCDDGIVSLHWNDLNYNLVSELSLLVGLIPLIIRTLRKRTKPAHNNVYKT